ncbi:MMPL family transporter [Cystobacter fuscus]
MTPSEPSVFAWLGRAVHRHRGVVFLLTAGVLVLAVFGILRGGQLSTGTIQGTEAAKAAELSRGISAASNDTTLAVIFHSDEWKTDDARFTQALEEVLGPVGKLPEVSAVVSPQGAPEQLASRLISSSGHDVLALVRLKGDEREAARAFPTVRRALTSDKLGVLVTGKVAFVEALDRLLEHDLLKAELISFPLALIVLLWVFRTLGASLLPIAVGGLAVMTGVSGVMLLAHVTDMAQYTINVVTLIGLGVAIDYSLFIVSRFRDELEQGATVEAAVVKTVDTAGRAVAFSGLAVAVGLSGLLFYPGSYLSAMGLGGAVVVAFAVLYSLTFLPALLSVLGPRVDWGRLPIPRFGENKGLWHRLAMWVMKHPWLVLLPTLTVLVAIGLPFQRLQLAATDITALPAETEARRGAEALKQLFPAQAATRILVTVQFPSGEAFTPERARALYATSRRLAKLPGVEGVESIVDLEPGISANRYAALAEEPAARPPEFDLALEAFTKGSIAVMQVLTPHAAASAEAREVVRAIRQERSVGDGQLLVGGQTAADVDGAAFIVGHSPHAVLFVMGLTYVVLFVLLRSVILPLKALLMNLLSIAGSFGALVWIFQEGHLSGLLAFEPRAIEPSLPILLFCALFGLSMDYEVLLLTRMREEWLRTHDNAHSVAEGLERTGGLITSAAAIMVAVFAAFSLAQAVVVKAMGVGMAIAVALDATLVRVLIVPAMMRLMGEFNWWAPAPLVRLLGGAHAPEDSRPEAPKP